MLNVNINSANLIHLGGAVKFASESAESDYEVGPPNYIIILIDSNDQENVQLQFEENSHIVYLPNSELIAVDYDEECTNPHATHVVTSVTYGFGAVFNFKHVEESGNYSTDVEVSLKVNMLLQIFNCLKLYILPQASIGLIPIIAITGEINGHFSEEEWNLLESTSLRMFGDFSPVDDSLPTNFTEAVHFYNKVRLNGSIDESWGGTKIKKVTLTPIQVNITNLNL